MATTKKPTVKQLAARKKFAQMAKDGTLAKKRKAAAKKSGLKAPAKKKSITAKKMCSKVIRKEGVKVDGTLKKGYKYIKGGKVVKTTVKPTVKKAKKK